MLKRTRDRLVKIGLGALSVATVFGLTAAVLIFAYSDRAQRDAERQQAASAQTDESNVEGECVALPSPEEIVACVRQEREATHDQRHTQSDLRAQHDMAAFAHGLLLFAALSFVTGVGGLAALVWTFRETRRMTSAQERAYLEFVDITFSVHGTYGTDIGFWVSNSGRTPAQNITFVGTFEAEGVDYPSSHEVYGYLDVLPGNSTRKIRGKIPDFLIHVSRCLEDYTQCGSHGKNTLTVMREDPNDIVPRFTISGKITWHDIYDRRQTINVSDEAELHFSENPCWIGGRDRPGRNGENHKE